MMCHTSLAMLSRVAQDLQGLDVVFVGGSILPIHLDLRPELARSTDDVDAITRAVGYSESAVLDEELRRRGFRHCKERGAPICRWSSPSGVRVDLVPVDSRVYGFSNRWYQLGVDTAESVTLPDGVDVAVLSPAALMLTKLAAYSERGRRDSYTSRDIDDVVSLLCYSSRLDSSLASLPREHLDYVRAGLQQAVDDLFGLEDMFAAMSDGFEQCLVEYGDGLERARRLLQA